MFYWLFIILAMLAVFIISALSLCVMDDRREAKPMGMDGFIEPDSTAVCTSGDDPHHSDTTRLLISKGIGSF